MPPELEVEAGNILREALESRLTVELDDVGHDRAPSVIPLERSHSQSEAFWWIW